jgi:general secretion pathway protein C
MDAKLFAEGVAGRHLFGLALESHVEQSPQTQTISNIKLRGVFAAIGSLPAFAIVSVDGKPAQPVQAGNEMAPGAVMVEVHPDYVLLRRNGATERIGLEKMAASTIATNIDMAEFKLNVRATGGNAFSFSRNELNQAMQDAKQLLKMGRLEPYPTGGMMVSDAPGGSLVDKLGLKTGDVIQRFNNQPFNSNGDVQKFVQQLQHVAVANLDLMRGGRPLQLKYNIQQ